MGISLAMNCPQCGGAVTFQEGERIDFCNYCGTSLWLIEQEKTYATTMFRCRMDRTQVTASAMKWFDQGLKARDLEKVAEIKEVYPIYLPFWRVRGRVAGWVCGYREETRTRRDSRGNIQTYTEKIPMEVMVLRDMEWSEIACDPGDLLIHHAPSLAGEAIMHNAGDIPTFEATTSVDDAAQKGKSSILSSAVASTNVPHVTFQKVNYIQKYVGMVYYPVWVVRYKYKGRGYFLTVDGITDKPLSGRAPGDPLYQALAMAGGASAGGIIAGLGTMFGLLWDSWAVVAGAIVAGIAILYGAYRFFRFGSERVQEVK